MRSSIVLSVAIFTLALAIPGRAVDVGAAIEVAPKAEKTRYQTWASASWSEGARCWLVVWREGYLNEPEIGSDIWCARVASDGKPLDPAGIRLTTGKGLKDRPRVASNGNGSAAAGKGWLVVWEDLSNGKDWDVRAALVSDNPTRQRWHPATDFRSERVSGDPSTSSGQGGNAPDAENILVAGGEDNQCRPDVAYSGDNYYVVWQAQGVSPAQKWKGYSILGGRVSPEGKVLDKPAELGVNQSQCNLPAVASHNGNLLTAFNVTREYVWGYVARREVDSASGQPKGAPPVPSLHGVPVPNMKGETLRTPALVLGPEGGLLVVGSAHKFQWMCSVLAVDKSGGVKGDVRTLGPKDDRHYNTPRLAVAAAGEKQFLVVEDYLGKGRFNICGWRVSADGTPVDDANKVGFGIAVDPAKDSILPAVASGPDGACLVVYSEVRGADDVKVLARIVK
ncbi:MAG: hypothetical protein C0404_04245 [Verrucomicrobia bacterium]|nr:hypothetical protein [Verrucomicrobiota bacterium]